MTFVVSASLDLTLVLLLASGLVALPFAIRRPPPRPIPGRAWVFGAGALFGLLLWRVAGNVGGDGFFHLARVQKLLAFGDLSLDSANEFPDGGLHPGYAFPLWHGFLACVAKLSGVDPELVVLHESSVLVPLAFLVVFEAGSALFRSAWLGSAVLAANVGLVSFAAGHGGSFVPLALPATASRQLLVPAVLLWVGTRGRTYKEAQANVSVFMFVVALIPMVQLFMQRREPDWIALVPVSGQYALLNRALRGEALPFAEIAMSWIVPAALIALALVAVARLWSRESMIAGK